MMGPGFEIFLFHLIQMMDSIYLNYPVLARGKDKIVQLHAGHTSNRHVIIMLKLHHHVTCM